MFFFRKDGKTLAVPENYTVRHTRYYGRKMGLTVLLHPAVHDYFAANGPSPGFRVSPPPHPHLIPITTDANI
jgi:hypothetical protein